jgi:hypothetical protein
MEYIFSLRFQWLDEELWYTFFHQHSTTIPAEKASIVFWGKSLERESSVVVLWQACTPNLNLPTFVHEEVA